MATPKTDIILALKAVDRSNLSVGNVRYNPTLQTFEEWDGTSWNAVTGGGGGSATTGANLHLVGEWSSGKSYVNSDLQIDVVSSGGSSYGALTSHTSTVENQPPNTAFWGVIASKGETGLKGDKGDIGSTGPQGEAATVTVGTTTTGAAGTQASVTNSGNMFNAVLNFTVPTGPTGPTGTAGAAATVTVGTTTTGAAGTNASVTNTGTSNAAVLAFTIPQGAKGATGAKGDTGETGPAGGKLNPAGVWTTGKAYVNDAAQVDSVSLSGTSYLCRVSHTSAADNQPPNETYWQVLSERGEQGPSGAVATATSAGAVKPDNTTITVDTEGTISAAPYGGATASAAGTAGIVPAGAAGTNTKYLRGDGTWQDAVTLDTAQTIIGSKTFTLDVTVGKETPRFNTQSPSLVKGTIPPAFNGSSFLFVDSEGSSVVNRVGSCEFGVKTDGTFRSALHVYEPVHGSSKNSYLGINCDVSGTFSTFSPHPADTSNNNNIATTNFVRKAITTYAPTPDLSPYAPLASPALTGTPTAPTPDVAANTTQVATTAFVKSNLESYAPIASPTLTGTPAAPTPATDTNTTQVATTAFVRSAISTYASTPVMTGATASAAGAPGSVPAPAAGDNSNFLGGDGTWKPASLIGEIKMWYGSLDSTSKYPVVGGVTQSAWHVCDGTDGTPDMRNRVPVGAGSSYSKGSTGGSTSHSHSISVSVSTHAAAAISGTTGGSYSGVGTSTGSTTPSGSIGYTTITQNQMPSHIHSIPNGAARLAVSSSGVWTATASSEYTHSTNATGGGQSHNHSFSGYGHTHTIPETSQHTHSYGSLKTPSLSHSASGSSTSESNMQPYLAVYFIMYLG